MKINTILLIGLITIATGLTLVLGFFHAQEAREIDDATLRIISNNKAYEIHLEDLMNFELTDFEATVRASGNVSETIVFSGIWLYDLFYHLDIPLMGHETVVFKSIDGFQSRVSAEEIVQPNNIYLVLKRNQQKTLARSEGGTGPMEIVIALDAFSQRWNKFLVEIEIIP